MPRQARAQSESGIYHVMLRGTDHREIFLDDEDNEIFLELLERYRNECKFRLYAYCLMGNHVHLLLQTGETPLEVILKKIEVAYAYRFNRKYDRCGALFQGRFRSEAVEDERYFLTVLRYILQNPVKAGICADPGEYAYSSMREYEGKDSGLTDVAFAENICGQAELRRYLLEKNNDSCLEMSRPVKKMLSDRQAQERIQQVLGASPNVSRQNREELTEKIVRLSSDGISIRQLSRLSGIPKGIIERSLK